MLIIGHRGAKGLKPENTLESLRAGQDADVDIIEFDVRLTKDKVPILLHDIHLMRTHRLPYLVNRMTYEELERRTAKSLSPVATLDAVLKEFGGQITLNLELKDRGCAAGIMPLMKAYIKKQSDWETFLFSSTHVSELRHVRKQSKKAQLALLHWYNPLRFLVFHGQLNLTAVGFHRLHVNSFIIGAAKKLDLFTYAYTINRPDAARRLMDLGIDGIVTDTPQKMRAYIEKQLKAEQNDKQAS